MGDPPCVAYRCSKDIFRPAISHQVRWLDWDQDFEVARIHWKLEPEAFRDMWNQSRKDGYQFCAVVEHDKIIALAAVWRYSETAWELAAVGVEDSHRRCGYGKSVCSFATSAILDAGRTATCHTLATNIAMQRTAESIGFQPP